MNACTSIGIDQTHSIAANRRPMIRTIARELQEVRLRCISFKPGREIRGSRDIFEKCYKFTTDLSIGAFWCFYAAGLGQPCELGFLFVQCVSSFCAACSLEPSFLWMLKGRLSFNVPEVADYVSCLTIFVEVSLLQSAQELNDKSPAFLQNRD